MKIALACLSSQDFVQMVHRIFTGFKLPTWLQDIAAARKDLKTHGIDM